MDLHSVVCTDGLWRREDVDVPVGASDRRGTFIVAAEQTEMMQATADSDAAQHQSTDEPAEQHARQQYETAVSASLSQQVSSLMHANFKIN